MFRVLYCNIGAEGQPDRTSTVSTDVKLLEKHSERSPLDVQSLITSLKFK